jgi:2-methylcitrate dehydratase PrpD
MNITLDREDIACTLLALEHAEAAERAKDHNMTADFLYRIRRRIEVQLNPEFMDEFMAEFPV